MNFAGLVLSPAYVVPGIQGISSGQNTNQDLTNGSANWTFQALNGSLATGTYNASGGNPGGTLEMTLPAGNDVGGEWLQEETFQGSAPFTAQLSLDVSVTPTGGAPLVGRLVVTLERLPQGLDVADAAANLSLNASTAWTTTPILDLSASVGNPGTYYLKVAYIAESSSAPTTVRFDNIRLAWATDAVFYFYLPLPIPPLLFLLYLSQASGPFLAYYGFIVVAILAAAVWYTLRERRLLVQAFTAPLEAIGTRLRSMSAWVAIAQVWLATTSFQYILILLFTLLGLQPSSPFSQTPTNAWVLLFDYSAASVFEEIAFRAFLIGAPMALAAVVWRLAHPNRIGARRSVLGALRYLWGGQLRRESSREAQLAAAILVLFSGVLFGLAHAPGWGWWKVLPALVAGLGMGYVFVRHGIGAAILVHFATDGSLALMLEGIGGDALTLVTDLLLLGLAIAGIGFLAWYLIYGWQHFEDLRRRFGAHLVRQPTAMESGTPAPQGWTYPPPAGGTGSSYSYQVTPPPVPAMTPLPGSQPLPPPGWQPMPRPAAPPRNAAQVPREYTPTYHPPPYGFPPVRFQCPYCGWVEARYQERRFTCLRCGRTA
jgi:membrane protease YdiL (CAAX protease family)